MTDDFYKLMAAFHKARREAVQAETDMLWAVAVHLLQAIDATPHDGSGTADLKKIGEDRAGELREYLVSQGAKG